MSPVAGTPTYLPFRDYVTRLERYLGEQGLVVETGTDTVSVRRTSAGFLVQARTAGGAPVEILARYVVNATGIISAPVLPLDFDPARYTAPWRHSLEVRSDDLRRVTKLLVVGGGASAGEVLDRWLEVRAPEARAWLSLRSKLRAIRNPILGLDVHYWVWLIEQAPAGLLGWRAGRMHEPMQATRIKPAIREGLIERVGPVARYDPEGVHLLSGERLQPDLLVFATGMRYATEHLGELVGLDPDGRPRVRRCESERTPGLFLLGYKFGRTFASPYLRGIARDARYVVDVIARRRSRSR